MQCGLLHPRLQLLLLPPNRLLPPPPAPRMTAGLGCACGPCAHGEPPAPSCKSGGHRVVWGWGSGEGHHLCEQTGNSVTVTTRPCGGTSQLGPPRLHTHLHAASGLRLPARSVTLCVVPRASLFPELQGDREGGEGILCACNTAKLSFNPTTPHTSHASSAVPPHLPLPALLRIALHLTSHSFPTPSLTLT